MTIKFVCGCGKHLRARDEMAARRSICPRCGNPVGVPSLKPIHPTGAPPMTPAERLRHARQRRTVPDDTDSSSPESSPTAPRPIKDQVVRMLSSRGEPRPDRTERFLEKHWYECLLCPLRAWRLSLWLALFMAALSAGVAEFLPNLLAEQPTNPWMLGGGGLIGVVLLVMAIGIPCNFLEQLLLAAVVGVPYAIHWSATSPLRVVQSGARWLLCFLAGPVLFAVTGWVYWLRCGEPTWLDWLILLELGVVTIAYWIFALLAMADCGRLRDINPVAVADLTHRLGWRALIVLAAALLFLAHGWVVLTGVAGVQEGTLKGWAMLAAGWVSGMFFGAFFCRLLGIWVHRSRPTVGTSTTSRSLKEPIVDSQ